MIERQKPEDFVARWPNGEIKPERWWTENEKGMAAHRRKQIEQWQAERSAQWAEEARRRQQEEQGDRPRSSA